MPTLGLLDLLQPHGLDATRPTKLVRHQDERNDMHELLRTEWLETYQRYQKKPVFEGLDYIVSFIGVGSTRARFVGVYKVIRCRPSVDVPLPEGCPYPEWQMSGYCYDLERDDSFKEFQHRLVVDWGRGTLAWHQHLKDKAVLELLPTGQLLLPFRDYLDFTLTYSELRYLQANPEANKEWRARLSAVSGVYLILAKTSGAQYVGSATGVEGIWGRWSAYAKNGHGDNVLLQNLISTDPLYPSAFLYSVLQVFPRTLTSAEVLKYERRFKAKLGTRAIGLNGN